MENQRNYYRVLHVQPDAPVELVRMAYRTMMQKLRMHPDLGGDEWNAAVVNEAYAVLADSERRAAYDRELLAARSMNDVGGQTAGQRERAAGPEPEPEPEQNVGTGCCLFCAANCLAHPDPHNDCTVCGCPLLPYEPDRAGRIGQRDMHRQAQDGTLTVYSCWQAPAEAARLVDVSLQGLCFSCGAAFSTEAPLKVHNEQLLAVVALTREPLPVADGYLHGGRFLAVRFARGSGAFVRTSA